MGIGGISPIQLIIILIIVLLIFGTKKLRNFGGDLGGAIKGFKKAVKEEGAEGDDAEKLEDEKAEVDDVVDVDDAGETVTAKTESEESAATKKES